MEPMPSKEQVARELLARAAQLFGPDRAEAERVLLEETAGYMWVVTNNLPGPEEEPAFFL